MNKIKFLHDMLKESFLGGSYVKLTISSPFAKETLFSKITISPKCSGDKLYYQFELFRNTKILHKNYSPEDAYEKVCEILNLYKQCDFKIGKSAFKALINKNGACKIIGQKLPIEKNVQPEPHNNPKNYIISETPDNKEHNEWLYCLGITNKSGKVLSDKQKKFRQINKFLEIVETIADKIPENACIVDIGCGKAYLTFALYHYLTYTKCKKVSVTGLDIKDEAIAFCSEIARKVNFSGLNFVCRNIEEYLVNDSKAVDMAVCLHACDTATDYALAYAAKNNASLILSAPCCQHELASQIQSGILSPLFRHGILKERFSALLTDSLRALLLEALGYKCNVIEFIDPEHTPKNIMLKAVKKQARQTVPAITEKGALSKYRLICNEYNVKPALEKLLLDFKILE